MKTKLPTAKEFLLNYSMPENTKDVFYLDRFGVDFLIEFAKLHVIEALKIASEKAETITQKAIFVEGFWDETTINKDSILNAYPLSNIV